MKTLQRISMLFACILLCSCQESASATQQSSATADLFAMDTYMYLSAYGTQVHAALDAASTRISALETTFSVTNATSDVAHINSACGMPTNVSADTIAVLETALKIGAESDGALDITLYPLLRAWGFTTGHYQVPDETTIEELLSKTGFAQVVVSEHQVTVPPSVELDFGAVAKGYTGDAVLEIFRSYGISSALINLGGNVQTLGSKPDGTPWKVGIANPFAPDTQLATIAVSDCAVITSGNYERYFVGEDGTHYWHILDAQTGYPAQNGFISVTVIGKSGVLCDALSTAWFVLGREGAVSDWRRRHSDFEMLCVTEDGTIFVTEGIAKSVTWLCDMPIEVIVRE